jgi:3-dehydroquinate dehydratase/shikimate dehydrogenase
VTLVCVPILVDDPDAALADAREARNRGADLVEFRVDPFFTGSGDEAGQGEIDRLVKLVSQAPLPCIVTCRPVLEGGHYGGPEDARIALFERLGTMAGRPGEMPPRYLDVELATYTRSENIKQKVNLAVEHDGQVRAVSTGLILSAHDFHTRPPDLIRQIERMFAEPACRVAKIAYRARSLRDNLELLEILALAQEHGKPMIALGMGPYGLMSRVLAPKFNAFLTFAALRRESATAPGQPVISELVETYRFKSIGAGTAVYGVMGDPVERSLSPAVHNAGFEAVGHDGVYLPLPVPAGYEHFKATLLAMIDHAHLDLRGVSVTIPHKENLVRLALEQIDAGDDAWSLDDLARASGAANTLVIDRDPKGRAARLRVLNTDGRAALGAIQAARPSVRKLLVLGAGGTARAVAAAAMIDGLEVAFLNRTPDKARALADELAGNLHRPVPRVFGPGEDLAAAGVDAVINCTPLGMAGGPAPGESPLNAGEFASLVAAGGPVLAADCVYRPIQTPFLTAARAAGMECVDGLAMFVRQAAEQFEAWTLRPAPRQLFDRVTRESLVGDRPGA